LVLNETDKIKELLINVRTQNLLLMNEEIPDNDANFQKIITQIFEKDA